MAYSVYGSAYHGPRSYGLSPNGAGSNGLNGHSPTDTPNSAVAKVQRHPVYYLNSGDIHFLVENYLFRVHRYFFERESAVFREKLGIPAPAGQSPKGSTDTNPYPLEDVRADDFSQFLWVFYNPAYSLYDADVPQWSAILKLAYDWRFSEVKKLCCRELEKFEIEPVLKIELYQRYDIDKKLLIPSYAALTVRAEPLSVREGRQLGLETALLLATARECARGRVSEHGKLSPTAASLDTDPLVRVIKEVFGLPSDLSSPPLSPITAPGGYNPITGDAPSVPSSRPAHSRQVSASITSSFGGGAARPGSPLASGAFSSFGEAANTFVNPDTTDVSTTLPADTPAVPLEVNLLETTSNADTTDDKGADKISNPETSSNAGGTESEKASGDGSGVADNNAPSDPPPTTGGGFSSSLFGDINLGGSTDDAAGETKTEGGADGSGDAPPATPAGEDGTGTDNEFGGFNVKKKGNKKGGGSGRGRGGPRA